MVANRMSFISSNNGLKMIDRSENGLLWSDSKYNVFNLSASNFIFNSLVSRISICFNTSADISDAAEKYSGLGLTGDRSGCSSSFVRKG